MFAILHFLIFFQQNTEVPLKPFAEFEIQIDFQFKQRSNNSTNSNFTIDYEETVAEQDRKRYGTGVRPYLILNVKLSKLSDQEVRATAENDMERTMYNKKVKEGDVIKIDMGFTDDVKARVSPHEVIVTLSSSQKKETSQIRLFVKEDGTFLVNGEVRGKF